MNDACNLQLKTILHSYKTGDHLVYNKKEQIFYTAGSRSSLDKDEYETHSQEVASLVKSFIQENHPFLNTDTLSQFSGCLENRIRMLHVRTTGLMGIFTMLYYAFNPQSKMRYQEQQLVLEQLKEVVEEASVQLQNIEEQEDPVELEDDKINTVDHNPPSPPHSPKHFSSKANLPENPKSPNLPTLSEKVNSKSVIHSLSPQELLPNKLKSPKIPTPSKIGSTTLPAYLNIKLATPNTKLSTPVKEIPGDIPAPPSPPPMDLPIAPPFTPAISVKAKAPALLANEPAPLPFEGLKYTNLTASEVSQQVESIGVYIEGVTNALKPLQDYAKKHASAQDQIKSNALQLSKLTKQRKQCEDDLKRLREGQNQNKVIHLFYKTPQGNTEIPFYPDSMQKQIIDKDPGVDKKLFYPCLKLSEAIEKFESLIQHFEAMAKELRDQQTELETEKLMLENDCPKIHKMDLSSLTSLVENKVKHLDSWSRYKNARQNWLDSKKSVKNATPASMRYNKKKTDAVHHFPLIDMLSNLAQNILLVLHRVSVNGADTEDIANEFETNFYGRLFAQEQNE